MLATSGGFVAICPKKEVELGADKLIHRADHAAELRQEIEFHSDKAVSNQYAHLPGGALRAINTNSSMTMAETDTCAGVFKGNLFNKADLALQLVGCPPHVNEAELLLRLYEAMGLDMLGRLQGQYAFCLYDSKQARVLAARDHSGAVPLLEGRTAAGSLIIACGTYLPEGVHQMVEIQPGEYKYGWHALPRAFRCGATKIVSGRASCEYGIRRRSIDAYNASHASHPPHRQQSLDLPRTHANASSSGHTPGRYVPPHAAGGYYGRQRAMSLDSSHWGPAPTSASSPHTSHSGGRRKSETNQQQQPHHGNRQHNNQHQHHKPEVVKTVAAVPATATTGATAATHGAVAAAKAAAAALATAAAATSAAPTAASSSSSKEVRVLPAAPNSPASEASSHTGDHEAGTQDSVGADAASPHRRKRRHRSRRHKNSSSSPGHDAAAADASSDTESQISTSTHDSNNSAPAAPAPAAAARGGKQQIVAGAAAGASKAATAPVISTAKAVPAPAAGGHGHNGNRTGNHHQRHSAHHPNQAKAAGPTQHKHQQHQHWQPKQQQQPRRSSSGSAGSSSGGFRRNNSCGELAAMGSSPTSRSVLLAAPQGLAC